MQIHIHIHHHNESDSELKQSLLIIQKQNTKIMANQQELAQQVKDLTAKVNKVGTETRTLLTKIDELTAIIAEGGTVVSPELQAAVDDLQIQVNVVDELVPDAPTEPPVEE